MIGGNTYLSSGHPVIRPYQWIRYMQLPNGSRPRMDLWGHNPYSFRKPFLESPASPRGRVDFSDLDDLTAALDRTFPGPPLPLYLSEWGVPTGLDKDLQFEVDTDTAVKWVQAAFEIVRDLGPDLHARLVGARGHRPQPAGPARPGPRAEGDLRGVQGRLSETAQGLPRRHPGTASVRNRNYPPAIALCP